MISKYPHVVVDEDERGNNFDEVFVDEVLVRTEMLIRAYENLKVMTDAKGKYIT